MEKALALIRDILAGHFDQADYRVTVSLRLQPLEEQPRFRYGSSSLLSDERCRDVLDECANWLPERCAHRDKMHIQYNRRIPTIDLPATFVPIQRAAISLPRRSKYVQETFLIGSAMLEILSIVLL